MRNAAEKVLERPLPVNRYSSNFIHKLGGRYRYRGRFRYRFRFQGCPGRM